VIKMSKLTFEGFTLGEVEKIVRLVDDIRKVNHSVSIASNRNTSEFTIEFSRQ